MHSRSDSLRPLRARRSRRRRLWRRSRRKCGERRIGSRSAEESGPDRREQGRARWCSPAEEGKVWLPRNQGDLKIRSFIIKVRMTRDSRTGKRQFKKCDSSRTARARVFESHRYQVIFMMNMKSFGCRNDNFKLTLKNLMQLTTYEVLLQYFRVRK